MLVLVAISRGEHLPLNITDLIMHEAAPAALGGTRPNNNSVSEIKQIISRYLHFYRDNIYLQR